MTLHSKIQKYASFYTHTLVKYEKALPQTISYQNIRYMSNMECEKMKECDIAMKYNNQSGDVHSAVVWKLL